MMFNPSNFLGSLQSEEGSRCARQSTIMSLDTAFSSGGESLIKAVFYVAALAFQLERAGLRFQSGIFQLFIDI